MTRPDLTALLERVEGASGPDRELDEDIFIALGKAAKIGGWGPHCCFTGSLDAAVALVEHVLPGWSWLVSTLFPLNSGIYHALIASHKGSATEDQFYAGHDYHEGKACTPALALLAALLRSLLAQEADEPRPMTGFIGTLTPDQKDKALAYDRPENHGAQEADDGR